MNISKIKVGSTTYDIKDANAVSLSTIPEWARVSSKPSYTAAEVGLDKVGNFKAVSTEANQGLSSTEKSNARANIGAGTSSFSGSYDDLSNKPSIPSLSGYATETWVSNKIDDLVGINADGVSTLASVLADEDKTTGLLTQIAGKVDKESGKGLSSNDYTTTEKNKLAGIASGATAVTETTVAGWGFTKNTGTLTSHQSVSSNNNTASWGSAVIVGTVGGTDLKFTMPSNPNTNIITSVAGNTGAVTADQIATALTGAGYKLTDNNTWTAASTSAAGYVPAATKGKFLHSNASTGALEWVDDNNTTYTLAGLMGSSAKGSTTQPIYWTGSAFANTSYTLGKSVPSDAVFTDTNTVTSINGKTGAIAAADIATVLTGAGYKLTDTDTNTWRPVGTGATDAAAGNHTHGISLATDSGTNVITLAHGTKYKLTAGGQSIIFTTPSDNNTTYSFTDANPTLAWGTKSKVATVGGVDIHVTMPANPNTNTTYSGSSTVTLTGTTFSLTKANVTTALGYTPPTSDTNTWRPLGTGASDACAGNDSRLSNSRPASDVYSWAKASSKPSYAYSEISYGVNAVTTSGAISLAGTTPLHIVTLNGNASSVALSANPPAGHSCHVIFTSTAERTVAIAHDATNRVCPEAADISFTVPANGYVEVDFLNANSKVYVRGV